MHQDNDDTTVMEAENVINKTFFTFYLNFCNLQDILVCYLFSSATIEQKEACKHTLFQTFEKLHAPWKPGVGLTNLISHLVAVLAK